MPDEPWRTLAATRQWREPPPAPQFRFDRRNAVQRAAGVWSVPVVLGALVVFAVVQAPLTRWLGWGWGQGLALWIAGWPVGMWWNCLTSGRTGAPTWKSGGLFAFASAGLYVWIFAGGWV